MSYNIIAKITFNFLWIVIVKLYHYVPFASKWVGYIVRIHKNLHTKESS